MYSLVAVALLAQTAAPLDPLPTSAAAPAGAPVALVRAEGMRPEAGIAVAEQISAGLSRHGIPSSLTPSEVAQKAGGELRACGASPECFAGVARALGAGALVTVDAAELFGELTVELALIDAGNGRVLADKVFAGALGSASVQAHLDDFARTSRYALMTLSAFKPPPAVAADAPRQTSLTPAVTPAAATRPTPVLTYAATGAAAAAGATAAIFGALSLRTYLRADAGRNPGFVEITQREAAAMTRDSVVAGVAGGACVLLTSAAIYLWMNPPQAER